MKGKIAVEGDISFWGEGKEEGQNQQSYGRHLGYCIGGGCYCRVGAVTVVVGLLL